MRLKYLESEDLFTSNGLFKIWNYSSGKNFPIFGQKFVPTLNMTLKAFFSAIRLSRSAFFISMVIVCSWNSTFSFSISLVAFSSADFKTNISFYDSSNCIFWIRFDLINSKTSLYFCSLILVFYPTFCKLAYKYPTNHSSGNLNTAAVTGNLQIVAPPAGFPIQRRHAKRTYFMFVILYPKLKK